MNNPFFINQNQYNQSSSNSWANPFAPGGSAYDPNPRQSNPPRDTSGLGLGGANVSNPDASNPNYVPWFAQPKPGQGSMKGTMKKHRTKNKSSKNKRTKKRNLSKKRKL